MPKLDARRILALNFGGIGDEILFFPALQSLREAYPQARITMLVEPRCHGICAMNPAIDEVLTFDPKHRPSLAEFLGLIGQLRERSFDLAIASGRHPAIPVVLFLAGIRHRIGFSANPARRLLTRTVPLNTQQYAGRMYHDLVTPLLEAPGHLPPSETAPARLPQVVVPPASVAWAREFLAQAGDRPVAVLHPGTSRLAVSKGYIKYWAPERWAQLALRLDRAGMAVALAGGPDDLEAIQQIVARLSFVPLMAFGQTPTLGHLAALVAQASLLIAVDSAPMHLGVATGTPVVALFGPTDPRKLLPEGTIHQAIYLEDLACRPCLWDRRATCCPELTCLQDLDVERVAEAALRILPVKVAS